jgi:mannose/fructose/N-acetylgalactosamine-specific phosphotransferase system component IIB
MMASGVLPFKAIPGINEMGTMHLRVDDRLIHGQVLVGWGTCFHYKFYIICDTELAASDWEKDMYLAAAPSDVYAAVVTPAEVPALLDRYTDDNGCLLIKQPTELIALRESGFLYDKVIIGGLHDKPGRSKILDYVFMNDTERELFQKLIADGIVIQCQDLPDHSPVLLSQLLQN